MQERQVSFSLLSSYLPLIRNLVQAITPILFEMIIFGRDEEEDQ